MSSTLFVRRRPGGTVHGPFTPNQLAKLAAKGKIDGQTQVSLDRTQWFAYDQVDVDADGLVRSSVASDAAVLSEEEHVSPPDESPRLDSPTASQTAALPAEAAQPSTTGHLPSESDHTHPAPRVHPGLSLKDIAASAAAVGNSVGKLAARAKQAVQTRADEAAERIGKHAEGETYSVFITYRREGGAAIARWLAEKLKQQGFHVFLDVDVLSAGDWYEGMHRAMTQCSNLVVIVTDDFFVRCASDEDVVRKEIALALSVSTNVVPLISTDNPFPHDLPADIQPVARMNGVRYRHEHADDAFAQLSSMLKGESSWLKLERGDPQPHKVLSFVAAVLGFVVGVQTFAFSSAYAISGWSWGLFNVFFMLFGMAWPVVGYLLLTVFAVLVHTLITLFMGKSPELHYGGKRWFVFWLTYVPMIAVPCLFATTLVTLIGVNLLNLLGLKGEQYSVLSTLRLLILFPLIFGAAIGTALITARIVIRSGAWKVVKRTFSILN
jgi:hypothetical protein